MKRRGISALVSCQNEEITVAACVLSFLVLADEVVVVDNGSTDSTKEICRELASRFPDRIFFHDVPQLRDLHENRQFALAHSRYQWVVRADADYILYTDGVCDARKLRDRLLARWTLPVPIVYYLEQPNVRGDFRHTLTEGSTRGHGVVSQHMPRCYRVFPGFRFERLGRQEGARLPRRFVRHRWPTPIWMHCDIKSELNYLYRWQRTNWRELGDYDTYPDLESYLRPVIEREFGTSDPAEAAKAYTETEVLLNLQAYDESAMPEYPRLVRYFLEEEPCCRIVERNGRKEREYHGPPDTSRLTAYFQDHILSEDGA